MNVPYSMDDSEPDLHCGMGGQSYYGDYEPTSDEVSAALADADEMNYNMRTFGTIDRPKGLYSQSDMDKVIQFNLKAVRAAYDEGFKDGWTEGNQNCQHR